MPGNVFHDYTYHGRVPASTCTSELKNQIDTIWTAFWSGWSGGISNPTAVLEQITYMLFIRRLDDAHPLEENKAANRPTSAGIEGRLPNGGHTLQIQRTVETGTAC